MTDKNLRNRLLVILAVVTVGAILIWPPQTKLRAGLDIAGGTSLILEIDDSDAKRENFPNLAEEMKKLLQRRVDPQGVSNIVWRVVGSNRLEVQMPLPPPQAAGLRKRYEDLVDELIQLNLTRKALYDAFEQAEPARTETLSELARRHEAPADLLRAAAERHDALQQLQREKQQRSQTAPATAPEAAPDSEFELALRDAREYFEDAIASCMINNIEQARLRDVLEMDAGSAARRASIEAMKQKRPGLAEKIDAIVAAHQSWRNIRGLLDGPQDLMRLLRGAGVLEFRILADPNPDSPTEYDRYIENLRKSGPYFTPGDRYRWFRIDNPVAFFSLRSTADLDRVNPASAGVVADKFDEQWYVLSREGRDYQMIGDASRTWSLKRAMGNRDEHGKPEVNFLFDARGGAMFRQLTAANIGKQLCILVDGVAYSSATIQTAIGTSGRITGDFSWEKVNYLVQTMQAGALPARLKDTPLSEKTIGSSLGQQNLQNAFRAGMVGLAAIVVFMMFYYGLSGMVANVCLLMNIFLVLAVMALLNARFTLDGIAGVILSIGMAVDANVLIYERMREEKERGSSLRMIIKNGYDKALSTILDSNITTLLTCLIIYYVGSEEIKGFGLTLGWGIALNIFTAVFVSRTLFTALLRFNILRDVKMRKLIGTPAIDWVSKARLFVPVSILVTVIGLALLFARGRENIFDIEFLGGVSAEVEVAEGSGLNDVSIGQRLRAVGQAISADAAKLAQAEVVPASAEPAHFRVRAAGIAAGRLVSLIAEPLEEQQVAGEGGEEQPLLARGGVQAAADGDGVEVRTTIGVTSAQLQEFVRGLSGRSVQFGENLARANIGAVLEAGGKPGRYWNVTTTVSNKALVRDALMTSLGTDLVIQPRVHYVLRNPNGEPYPIRERRIDAVVPGLPPLADGDLTDLLGGAAYHLDQLNPPQSAAGLRDRLRYMRMQALYQDVPFRMPAVFGVTPATDDNGVPLMGSDGQPRYSSVVVALVDPDFTYESDTAAWAATFGGVEWAIIRETLETEQSLRRVSQFKPQVAAQAQTQAILAVVLSWVMIIGYVWLRFGRVTYGFGGVAALVHDVLIALAFIGVSGWLGRTALGHALLIEDFKIDMTIIAALLTIIGYSINDTIVIFDRIRELRGRLGIVTADVINNAINQTFSRTILTVLTVLIVLFIMYVMGGSSIRGFTFCMLIGSFIGAYSTIVIAAPLLLVGMGERSGRGGQAARA